MRKWQQEIPSRGRGRRVKRGGGLASATQEEIEELKWQERKDWDHPGTYGAQASS